MRTIAAALLLATLSFTAAAQEYDLVLRGGRLVDGTGAPWREGDLAIRDGRIAAIGRFDGRGAREVDARGLVIAPGFIDVHAHAEEGLRERLQGLNFVHDGVTTIVTGNCGGSAADLGTFFAQIEAGGLGLNAASLIGHNTVRRTAMGMERRPATAEELAKMQAHVDEAMRAGAVGLATGLIYTPGTWADTAEVVALAQVAARHGGLYATHMRSEGEKVKEAIAEAIDVGRRAGLPVQISHFKIAHKKSWGRSNETIALVERARAEGIDVAVDQYPYPASSTSLSVMLPDWALEGGRDALIQRLRDGRIRGRIADEMKDQIRKRNGRKDLSYAVVARYEPEPSREGRSIQDITLSRGEKSLEAQIHTVLEMMEKGGAGMVYFSMSDEDVDRILAWPLSAVASDAGIPTFGNGKPHPRGYGTNARVLGHYVRERRVISLEEAVRKMTSLPAHRFGFTDRGLLRPGLAADVVVFDPKTVADRATFAAPHAYSEGFRLVLVNGVPVIDDGRPTDARPGRVLRGPGWRPDR